MAPIDSDTSAYIRRVNALPGLTREEELALAARYLQERDLDAGRRVISANLRHVVPVALRHRRYGVPLDELIAEGNLAISRALKGFDPQRGLRFATYANYWIRADILALILRQRSLVGGGRGELRPKYFFRLRREHARLALELADPSAVNEALAVRWKLSTAELEQILDRLERPDASLDAPLTDEQRASLGDCLPAVTASQEDALANDRTRNRLERAVALAAVELDSRERFILEHRLMADPELEYSLVRIGELFGVSRERARQLESRVKTKLKERLGLHLTAA
jgi:RNA polymerase sigma-32 factor